MALVAIALFAVLHLTSGGGHLFDHGTGHEPAATILK
jgi:hypothetical protein